MSDIPKFQLYDAANEKARKTLMPDIQLRGWETLSAVDKKIAFGYFLNAQHLQNHGWPLLNAIRHLNEEYLRICPGMHLFMVVPKQGYNGTLANKNYCLEAAGEDFKNLFLNGEEFLVMSMFSAFLMGLIERSSLRNAQQAEDTAGRKSWTDRAYEDFDKTATTLNHIFEQFAINQLVTRSGIVPRQDAKITEFVYVPTLAVLADPKWKAVSEDLAQMFSDYRNKEYPDVIAKAHSALQRFLQVLVGDEGSNGRGEMGKLFGAAKKAGLLPINRFTEPMITVFQSFVTSERATNSTAKPAIKDASPSEALLVMNVVMVLFQFCLQNTDG